MERDAERSGRGEAEHKFSGAAQFEMEAKVLGKYRHPNIVALLGHCLGTGRRARPCLVYESWRAVRCRSG